MTLREKILYALVCFTYINRQATLTMCENPVYGYRIITDLIKKGCVKEMTRRIKVKGRPRQFTCLRITAKGLAYLRDFGVKDDDLYDIECGKNRDEETGWTRYLPAHIDINEKGISYSSIDLYHHLGQSTATMVSLMAGAAVLPLTYERGDTGESSEDSWGYLGEGIESGDKVSNELNPGEKTFAEDIEELIQNAMTAASPEQKLNGYVFNSQSDLIFYNTRIIKDCLSSTNDKKALLNYRASRFAGILQSPLKSVIMYTGRKGGMSWAKWIVNKENLTYRAFTVHHSKYGNKDAGVKRGVLLVESPHMLDNIYNDRHGFRKKNERFGAPTAVQAAKDAGKPVYSVGYNVDNIYNESNPPLRVIIFENSKIYYP